MGERVYRHHPCGAISGIIDCPKSKIPVVPFVMVTWKQCKNFAFRSVPSDESELSIIKYCLTTI